MSCPYCSGSHAHDECPSVCLRCGCRLFGMLGHGPYCECVRPQTRTAPDCPKCFGAARVAGVWRCRCAPGLHNQPEVPRG
jgi:hypothetical protein